MDDLRRRARQVGLLMVALFLLPAFQLWNYQVNQAAWLDRHDLNPRRVEEVDLRGRLLDRQGRNLAFSKGRRRLYPLGSAAAPLLGYWSRRRGMGGLERALDGELLGHPKPRTLDEVRRIVEVGGRQGDDVILTLDADLQKEAYAALEGRRGAVVLLEVDSARVLAAATFPSFDPARLDEDWARLNQDPQAPFIERATQGLYPPGSTFKLLVVAAVLTDGLARVAETFVCTGARTIHGFVLHDAGGSAHGALTLQQALVKSCNSTFAALGERLGLTGIKTWMGRAGMLQAPPLVLVAAAGRAPAAPKDEQVGAAEAGIGQGTMLVTPLSLAVLVADLARGGEHVDPTLLRARRAGKRETPWAPPARQPFVTREVAKFLTEAMVSAVETGTGQAARIEGVRVGGKTGTAENPQGQDHAWFVGFAGNYAVAVILENQGFGGVHAAPAARRVLQAALRTI